MKVYVKKDKALKLLGEGRIFTKKDLILKEDTGISASLNPEGGDVNANQAQTASSNIFNHVPSATATTLQSDDVNGVTAPMLSQNDPASDVTHEIPLKDANASAIQAAAKQGGTIKIVKQQPQQNNSLGLQNSSVTPRKVMDEMRENSVPFTKSELTEFLKNL
jgi:hypothetical protein